MALESWLWSLPLTLSSLSHGLATASIVTSILLLGLLLIKLRHELLHGGAAITRVRPPASASAQMAVTKVSLPFHLQLDPPSAPAPSSLRRLHLAYSSRPPFRVGVAETRVYAGVTVHAFHHVLRAPWPWMRQAFRSGQMFGGEEGCLKVGPLRIVEIPPDAETLVTLDNPHFDDAAPPPLDLGSAPRTRFPFVICTLLTDADAEGDANAAGRVGALLHAVHVRDETCRVPTQFLSTHVKQMDGQVTQLRQIFLAEDHSVYEEGGGGVSQQQQQQQPRRKDCVICHEGTVTRVMLPCRHACVCRRCFGLLRDNQCPMCRCTIQSYFLMEEEGPDLPENDDERETGPAAGRPDGQGGRPRTFWQTMQHWNERLARAMGLQENNL